MAVFKMERDPNFPLQHEGARMYVLVRSDIPQMNPGKLGAQTHHAGTKAVFDAFESSTPEQLADLKAWAAQTADGFGTCITLSATESEIRDTVATMTGRYNLLGGVVIDPTYPMVNHFKVPFTRPELTCGYVLVPATATKEVLDELKQFDLHP